MPSTEPQIPAGRILRVELEVVLPVAATHRDVLEWLEDALGGGGMDMRNPLVAHEPTAWKHSITASDTYRYGWEEHTDHWRDGNRYGYKIHYVTSPTPRPQPEPEDGPLLRLMAPGGAP